MRMNCISRPYFLKRLRSWAIQIWAALSLVTLEDRFVLTCAVTNRGAQKVGSKLAVNNQRNAKSPNTRRFLFFVIAGAWLRWSNVRVPIWDSTSPFKSSSRSNRSKSAGLPEKRLEQLEPIRTVGVNCSVFHPEGPRPKSHAPICRNNFRRDRSRGSRRRAARWGAPWAICWD